MESIYDITVTAADCGRVSMAEYAGKVLLIVNTATGCGFTPQYASLQSLYDKYSERGFVVLDFPCNQFAGQAPGTMDEINSFCTLNYGTTFPRFAKIKVNGEGEDPLFTFLKSRKKGVMGGRIKWNFTKFLVSRTDEVVKRYAPVTAPEKMEEDILRLL